MLRPPRSPANPLAVAVALVSVLLSACLDEGPPPPDGKPPGHDPATTSNGGDRTNTGMPPTTSEPPGTSGATKPADESDGAPVDFIMTPDGGPAYECDLFAQDCPPGDKCMPWANDGGPAWTGTRCSPIADDPGQEGDPCTVVGGAMSGVDDCALGLMCWWVDETGAGTCEDMCTGSADNPSCDDPNEACPISAAGVLILCLDVCDPLAQDCEGDGACYPVNQYWLCVPDLSGRAGANGDPCEYIAACDEGHVCLGAAAFTHCEGALGCCSSLCNVDDDTADAACAALDPGQSCEPWYFEDNAPRGYESVGVCALPA